MSTYQQRSLQSESLPDTAPSYVIGRDPEGRWIALETHGLAGGIFRSQEAAADYAAFETHHRPGAVLFASEPVSLRL